MRNQVLMPGNEVIMRPGNETWNWRDWSNLNLAGVYYPLIHWRRLAEKGTKYDAKYRYPDNEFTGSWLFAV